MLKPLTVLNEELTAIVRTRDPDHDRALIEMGRASSSVRRPRPVG